MQEFITQSTIDDIKSKLNRHIEANKSKWSFSRNTFSIENCKFVKIYVYELWTLTESRSKEWVSLAIKGLEPGGEKLLTDPDIWELGGDVRVLTENGIPKTKCINIQVPGSEYVTACDDCGGEGSVFCTACTGKRSFICDWCDGAGAVEFGGKFSRKRMSYGGARYSTCHARTKSNLSPFQVNRFCHGCKGLGRVDCSECGGSTEMTCDTCRGKGCFKHFLKIKIHWAAHKSAWSCASEDIELPSEAIVEAKGEQVWEEAANKVDAFSSVLVEGGYEGGYEGVVAASQRLIDKHSRNLESENSVIKLQKHSLRVVPLTRVAVVSKKFQSPGFILGTDDQVCLVKKTKSA